MKIKPCPFCGGEAEIVYSWLPGRLKGRVVSCKTDDCMGVNVEQDEQGGFIPEFYTDEKAIEAWNTRAAQEDK